MQHFIASDGVRVAYDDEGGGRPLVLLHGLMAHRGFFARQRELATHFRIVNVDLRGHGESRAATGLTIEQLAEDVSALAEALDLNGAIGIGWSLGASVLWRVLAGPQSGRFAASVIVDMTPRVANDSEWRLGLSSEACEARRQAIENDFQTFATNAGQAIFAHPDAGATARWAGEEFARNDPAAISALWSSLAGEDFRATLGRIRQPTLIVHGARSHLYGSDTADHLGAAIPHSRILEFERSGHSPHIEQPDLFNQTIQDFAASLPRFRDHPNAA